jgi:hypothetical protein
MYSKITLFGNPVHPVLGAHPLTFSIATFVAYLVYPRGGNLPVPRRRGWAGRAGDPARRARPRRGGILGGGR